MDPKEAPPFAKDGAHPAIQSLVYDERRGLVGTVEAIGYRVTLRPQGGGREWNPEWDDIRPATQADILASRVQVTNRANGSMRAATHPEIARRRPAADPSP